MFKQYINGNTVPGKGRKAEVINPATEEIAGEYMCVDASQALQALESAHDGFIQWSAFSLLQREKWILKLRDAIIKEKDTLVGLLMSETGKPLDNAASDFQMLVDCLAYFNEEAKRINGTIMPDYNGNVRNFIVRQPLGVVVGYLAWNFPLLNVGYKLGPVLASGCTCVLKPSSKTPLATLYLGEIAEKIGFPSGVINILAGSGNEIAEVMNKSEIPKMLTLIGSSETGRNIISQSATSIKHFSLELGGNAPAIVMPDADIYSAARLLTGLKFGNTGQICVSPNRVFVHESVHDTFVQLAVKYTKELKLGWGCEPGAQVGPMISAFDRERVLGLIEDALKNGATLMCGGKIPEEMQKGYYILPTVLDNVKMEMRTCKEEIFGPVMPICSFTDRDQVIKEANNTEYGLASYLFTNSMKDAFEIAEKLEFGTVCINEPFFAVNLPHGGIKESGIGKDCSVYSLEEYYHIKRISIRT